MQQINDVINFIKNLQANQIIDIFIALVIIVIFKIFSPALSTILVKLFSIGVRKNSKAKESSFYDLLRIFFNILGIYVAILFLKQPLNIQSDVFEIITKIFKIISIIIIARGLAKSVTTKSSIATKMKAKMNKDVDDAMFGFILKVIRAIIYIVAAFLVITELGYNLNGLIAGLGLGGVILTLAAQDTAKNIFAGLTIFLDRPFVVGDWIEVTGYEGTVEDITFRCTRVRTFENSLVNIPNSILANSSIINWSRMEKRRYKINLCLELDTPLDKVEKLEEKIYNMLQQHEEVIDDSIIVRVNEITDNGINILVYGYTNSVSYATFLEEKEAINYKLLQLLKQEKIELAYNTQTIYVKN